MPVRLERRPCVQPPGQPAQPSATRLAEALIKNIVLRLIDTIAHVLCDSRVGDKQPDPKALSTMPDLRIWRFLMLSRTVVI